MSDPPAVPPPCSHAPALPPDGPRRAAPPEPGGDLTEAPVRETGAAVDGAAVRLTMEHPVACVLRVRGALAPWGAADLGGLRITPAAGGDGPAGEAVTELRGALPNQAALLAVLRTLHTLGVAVRSVACTPRPGRPGGASPGAVTDAAGGGLR